MTDDLQRSLVLANRNLPLRNVRSSSRTVVLDQFVSSGGNYLLGLTVAHYASTAEFGMFSLVYVLLTFAVGLARAMYGETALRTERTELDVAARRRATRRLALLLGMLLVAAAVGAVVIGRTAALGFLLVAACACPVLIELDRRRYDAFRSSPGQALRLDSIWFGAQVVAFGSLLVAKCLAPNFFLAAWVLAGLLALTTTHGRQAVSPTGANYGDWTRRTRPLRMSFGADYSISTGSSTLSLVLAGSLLSPTLFAPLRAGQLIGGPLVVGLSAVPVLLIPRLSQHPKQAMAIALQAGLIAALASVVWFAALELVPSAGMRFALGETSGALNPLLPAFLCYFALHSATVPAVAALKSISSGKRIVVPRMISALSMSFLPISALLGGDSRSAAWSLVASAATSLFVWWAAFVLAFKREVL